MVFQLALKMGYLPATFSPQMAQAADAAALVWATNQNWYPVKGGYAKPVSGGVLFYMYSAYSKSS